MKVHFLIQASHSEFSSLMVSLSLKLHNLDEEEACGGSV